MKKQVQSRGYRMEIMNYMNTIMNTMDNYEHNMNGIMNTNQCLHKWNVGEHKQ